MIVHPQKLRVLLNLFKLYIYYSLSSSVMWMSLGLSRLGFCKIYFIKSERYPFMTDDS